jgi:predicted DCC family thiol-disulfide oxidoreductase YuxK
VTQLESGEQHRPVTTQPVLLYNDECAVCRRIAAWVTASSGAGEVLDVRPIGDDPEALRSLNAELDIWDAYATIHLLMPDGSMETGGEAVAEVFRRLPHTRWFAWTFRIGILGLRPFQLVLNAGYAVLADTRPVFGCESCGTPSRWLRPFAWLTSRIRRVRGTSQHPDPVPHLTRVKPAA